MSAVSLAVAVAVAAEHPRRLSASSLPFPWTIRLYLSASILTRQRKSTDKNLARGGTIAHCSDMIPFIPPVPGCSAQLASAPARGRTSFPAYILCHLACVCAQVV